MTRRSSDIPARETEFDRSVDDIAQWTIEAGLDWRKPYYTRRGIAWARLPRLDKPEPPSARVAA